MAWGRLDDDFHSHPKTVEAGNEAVGAFARLISWCRKYKTNGFAPENVVRQFCGADKVTATLVRVGFLDAAEGGYRLHDFLHWNPSAEETEAYQSNARAQRVAAGKRSAEVRKERAALRRETNESAPKLERHRSEPSNDTQTPAERQSNEPLNELLTAAINGQLNESLNEHATQVLLGSSSNSRAREWADSQARVELLDRNVMLIANELLDSDELRVVGADPYTLAAECFAQTAGKASPDGASPAEVARAAVSVLRVQCAATSQGVAEHSRAKFVLGTYKKLLHKGAMARFRGDESVSPKFTSPAGGRPAAQTFAERDEERRRERTYGFAVDLLAEKDDEVA